MPDNPIVDMARKFRDDLEALDEETLSRIVTAYQRIFARLNTRVELLVLEISTIENPTNSQIYKLARWRELERQIVAEITTFQTYLKTEIQNGMDISYSASSGQARELITSLLSQAGIQAQLGNLPTGAVEVMTALLSDGSPLSGRIDVLAGTVADYVKNTLADAIALGYNPRKTASLIQNAFGRGLTDALRMARTAQLWAQRIAAQQEYQNSGVLDGWVWYAQLDATVCQSCIVQHGTIYPVDVAMNDHHNGRCVMLPYIEEFGNPIEQTGIQWFEQLPEAQQKAILGPGKFEAWKAGQFTLPQLSREVENDVYGMMRSVTPLKDLVP